MTLGGPIKKDKLFYFVSYQGVRIADGAASTVGATVPFTLTNDRSAAGLVATVAGQGSVITASQISPVAMALLEREAPERKRTYPDPNVSNLRDREAARTTTRYSKARMPRRK